VTLVRTTLLFVVTAVAEILGCYLPYLWLKRGRTPWLLIPTGISLAVFSWLLTLPATAATAAARTYAAYGGVYIAVALLWLWLVEGQRPTRWDLLGASVALAGMAIIVLGPRR
jgi:small multidrug resistance family-3 protein